MQPPKVELRDEWDTTLESFLAERLYEFNSRTTGLFDGKPVVASIKDETDRCIAAITGHTWGGTCQVTHLWVDESRRGMGLGSALLGAVEAEARRRRCTQIILFTHSFQAPGFYEQLDYRQQATIPDYPSGHAQLLYVKQLDAVHGA